MRKRLMCLLLSLLLIFSIFSSITVIAAEEIKVVLDGQELLFDVPPQLINSRTMVPMRKIFEAMGANVEWDGNTQTINAQKDNITITMQIDNKVIIVNGDKITLDVPPQLVNSRTLVPARAVAESLKANVDWNGETKTVIISSNNTSNIDNSTYESAYDFLYDWVKENGLTNEKYISCTYEHEGCLYKLEYDSEYDNLIVSSQYFIDDKYCYTSIQLDSLFFGFSFADVTLYGYLPSTDISEAAALLYDGYKGNFKDLEEKYAFLEMAKSEVFDLIYWLDSFLNEKELGISSMDIGIPSINKEISAMDAHAILKEWIKNNGEAMGDVVSVNHFDEPDDEDKYNQKSLAYNATDDYVYIADSACKAGKIQCFTMIKLLQENNSYKYACRYLEDAPNKHELMGELEPDYYGDNTPIKYEICDCPQYTKAAFLELGRTSIMATLYFLDDYLKQCVGSISAADFGFILQS